MIDLMTLATGPKHCQFEIKDFKTLAKLGKLSFDIHVKQLQTLEVVLHELKAKFNGKEEKPLY